MVRNRMEGGIKKGPWNSEEDAILRNFVNENGPKDWSSIRSKGLLPRTGKSCRLRWVNKLQPNLKKGCKFSAEEERMILELQAVIGNKWAAIATNLPGRTDNDVKNFWSTRQKRLARILRSSSQSNKALKKGGKSTAVDEGPSSLQESKFNSNQEKPAPMHCGFCSCFCSENYNVVENLAPLPQSLTSYPLSTLTNPSLGMQTNDIGPHVSNSLLYPYEQMSFTNATISDGVRLGNQDEISIDINRSSYAEFPTPLKWTPMPALTPALNCVGPAPPLPLVQEMPGFGMGLEVAEQNFMEGYGYQEDIQLANMSEQPDLEATDENYGDNVDVIPMPQDTFDDFSDDMLDDHLETVLPKSSSS